MGEPKETSASIARWRSDTFGPLRITQERFELSCALMRAAMDAVRDMDWHPGIERPNLTIALRAAEELAELIEMLVEDDAIPYACEEAADVSIVLDGILGAHGRELEDERAKKMAVNRARKWKMTGEGCGQHVKEDE